MMLSTSLRRAVRTTTTNSSSIPFPAILPSVSAVASAKNSFVTATNRRQGAQHQRRYSSSKPPVPPNDGSHPIDTSSSSQTPAKGGVNNGNKSAGKSASDKAKDSHGRKASKSRQAPAPFLNLPSVPSTQDTPMQGESWRYTRKLFFFFNLANITLFRYTSCFILLGPPSYIRQYLRTAYNRR